MTDGYPDDVPGEAEFREEFGHLMEIIRAMELDEAVRPKVTEVVEGRITWEEFREYLRDLQEKRLGARRN